MEIFIVGLISVINLPSTYIVTQYHHSQESTAGFFFFFDRQQKKIINNHSQPTYTGNVLKGQKSRTKITKIK